MKSLRKKIWIDRLQTRMITQLVVLCVGYQAALWFVLVTASYFSASLNRGPEVSVASYTDFVGVWPALLCFLGVIPVFAYSVLKFTHRVVGPIVPIRRAIEAIREGQPVETIRLRSKDELQELAGEFNEMLLELEKRGAITLHRARPVSLNGNVIADLQKLRQELATPSNN